MSDDIKPKRTRAKRGPTKPVEGMRKKNKLTPAPAGSYCGAHDHVSEDEPLSAYQLEFVRLFTTGPNAGRSTLCARDMGVDPTQTSRWLGAPNVQKAVREAQERIRRDAEEKAGVTLAEVLLQLKRLAMFDTRALFNADGSVRPPSEWPDDIAAVIAGVEVQELNVGKGDERQQIGVLKKVKLIERTKSLDMLMRHLGGYEVDNRQKGSDAVSELAQVIGSVQGDACRVPIAPPDQRK